MEVILVEGGEGPDPESYSRVTNFERFRPLHAFALDLIDRLTAEYDVVQSNSFALRFGMSAFDQARLPVTLTPPKPEAAPVTIAFTNFPSLVVCYGRWASDEFPSCGCDACAETADREEERLDGLIRDVVAGGFREETRIPLFFGHATLRYEFGEIGSRYRSGGSFLSRDQARGLLAGGAPRVQWQPWERRKSETDMSALPAVQQSSLN
jgi:hypothetical protein